MACVVDTESVNLEIAGGQLQADVIIDPAAAKAPNMLAVGAAGVYVNSDGWTELPTTLAYSATTNGMYVCTSSADVTAFVGVGNRVRLVHGGVTKYFVVAAVAAGSLTLYGGGTYTLAAGAISAPYFSPSVAPVGMPQFGYTAATVAELNALFGGAPPHGAAATLRQGTTPYRFLRVFYDATYAKWVSDPISCGGGERGGVNSASATSSPGGGLFDYGAWIAAGLTLQARAAFDYDTSDNTKTHYAGIYIYGHAQGNGIATAATTLGEQSSTATNVAAATDWLDVASLGATYEVAEGRVYCRDQGTGDLCGVHGGVEVRWRS